MNQNKTFLAAQAFFCSFALVVFYVRTERDGQTLEYHVDYKSDSWKWCEHGMLDAKKLMELRDVRDELTKRNREAFEGYVLNMTPSDLRTMWE
jgi:hypothetical protein